jgi:hypothetical protein
MEPGVILPHRDDALMLVVATESTSTVVVTESALPP